MAGRSFLASLCRANGCGRCCKGFGAILRRNLLLVSLLVGAVTGLVIGIAVNDPVSRITNPEKKATVIMLINFPGELFMNMLKMIILPLVVASLITAVSTLDPKVAGKVGRRTMLYYVSTMVLAAIVGTTLVMSIRPGSSDKPGEGEEVNKVRYRNLDSLLDMIRSCFPSNLVAAAVSVETTKYISVPAKNEVYNVTGGAVNLAPDEKVTAVFDNGTVNITTITKLVSEGSDTVPAGMASSGGMNIVGWTVFSIVLGIVLGMMRENGKPLVQFFTALNEAILRIVLLIMWMSPLGVCSLVAARLAGMDDILGSMEKLGIFIVTVVAALLVHSLIVLPLIFFAVTRKNPFKFMKGLRDALMTSFGISSSAATLPTTIRCVEENNNVDPRISRFMLPLGATVNMDGSALYRVVTVLFIAQLNDMPLDYGRVVVVCLMSVALAIGAAGIPASGVETIVVLQAVGLPLHDMGLIMAVDWFLDRARTTVNVLGDAMGTGIVHHLSRDDLENMTVDHEVQQPDDDPHDKDEERLSLYLSNV